MWVFHLPVNSKRVTSISSFALFKYTPVQLWHSQACVFPVNDTELCPRKHHLLLQARCQSWHALMMLELSLKQDWTVLGSSWIQNNFFFYCYTLLKIITQRNLWHSHGVACGRLCEQKHRTCLQSAAHCSLTFSKKELLTVQRHWLFFSTHIHFFLIHNWLWMQFIDP